MVIYLFVGKDWICKYYFDEFQLRTVKGIELIYGQSVMSVLASEPCHTLSLLPQHEIFDDFRHWGEC